MTRLFKKAALLSLAAALFACSSGTGSTALVDSTGNHPSDWVQKHWIAAASLKGTLKVDGAAAVFASATPCAECHGKDLLGGVSKVSCFSQQNQSGVQCHPTVLGHPADFARAIGHGQGAAMAAAGVSTGFTSCTVCHGSDYRGGAGKARSCFSCHTTAPHPPKPWIGGNLSHITTSPSNAAACFQCHAGGANFGPVLVSAPLPMSPAAPTPDCFNNTLCHGGQVTPPHQTSAGYLPAAGHGTDAAGKNPLKPELGISTCASCHAGADGRFTLTTNNMVGGCEGCHAPFTAHPTPWLPGRAVLGASPNSPNLTSHATVPAGTLQTQCAPCHGPALDGVGGRGNAPSCGSAQVFGILCHATSPVQKPAGCTSCHPSFVGGKPATGAHTAHNNLNVGCEACHSNAGADPATGIGRALHANGFLNVSSVYWAKTGGFRYDRQTGTCANVRCHGGQTTPAWNGGSLDVATQCLACHEQGDQGNTPQTPQFNSFYSGLFTGVFPAVNLHRFHVVDKAIFCTDCHTVSLAQHFGSLADIAFPTAVGRRPGDTIIIPGSYDVGTATCSAVACHNLVSKTATWK